MLPLALDGFEARLRADGAHEPLEVARLAYLPELGLGLREAGVYAEALGLRPPLRLCGEVLQRLDHPFKAQHLHALLRRQALLVPLRGQQALAREKFAHLWRVDREALGRLAAGHASEDGLQGRASVLDGAVREVALRGLRLRLGDVVYAVDVHREVLGLRPQHRLVEDLGGTVEDPAHEVVNEARRDAVAQTARGHHLAANFEVLHALQVTLLDEEGRVPLLFAHAAPELGHEEADVVVHPAAADEARRAREAAVAREDPAHERRVQVRHVSQGVEGPLRQGAFGARAGGGGRLPGDARDEVHEELRQLLVVQGVVDGEGPDRRAIREVVRRVVPPAGEHAVHGEVRRHARRCPAPQSGGHLRDVPGAEVAEVRPHLQVPRVRRRLAVDDAEVRGTDHVGVLGPGSRLAKAALHGLRELAELHGLLHKLRRLGTRERLEVRHEVAHAGHVLLALRVAAPDDGVVRPLEQAQLAIPHELDGGVVHLSAEILQVPRGHDDGGGDIVLGLDLRRRHEVEAEVELPRAAVRHPADTEVLRGAPLPVDVDDIALATVDDLHCEVRLPIAAPGGFVAVLHEEDEAADHRGDGLQPIVVLFGVGFRGRQQLHDRAHRSPWVKDRQIARPLAGEPVGVVPPQDHVDVGQVALDIVNAQVAESDHVAQQLGDFRLAAAGDRRRLVAVHGLRDGAYDVPTLLVQGLLQRELVSRGVDVAHSRH
mmetsp:Transcript_12570/g.25404  ORF Transcript_12570/g.25404 Transcript_12570/m.25404 type:complete len:714 (-) Transcript_12570:1281-3422(-)